MYLKFAEVVQVSPADLFTSTKNPVVDDVDEVHQLRVLMKRWPPAKRRALVVIAKTISHLDR